MKVVRIIGSQVTGGVSRHLDAEGRSFDSLAFQQKKPVLDSELNLVQRAVREWLATAVKQVYPSGFLGLPSLTYPGNPDNKFLTDPGLSSIGGYILEFRDPDATNGRVGIQLAAPPGAGTRQDLAFLEVWFQEVAPTGSPEVDDEDVYKYGGVQNQKYTNDLKDPVLAAETTRRIQLRWRIREVSNGLVDFATYPDGVDARCLADPTQAPSLSATAQGGTLPKGTYYCKYTYKNTLGETLASPGANITTPPIAASTAAPTLGQVPGGSMAQRTYYVVFTWFSAYGETTPSPEASLVVNANNLLTVTVPTFPSGVVKAGVYVWTTSGGELKQAEITTSGGTWTEPVTGLVSGAAPPGTNTAQTDLNTLTITAPALPSGATGINAYIGTVSGQETKQGTSGTNVYTQSTPLSAGQALPTRNTTHPVNAQGGASSPQAGYVFSAVSGDSKLFRAGDGSVADATALGTVDGYVYGLSMFQVARTAGDSTIDPGEVTDKRYNGLLAAPRVAGATIDDTVTPAASATDLQQRLSMLARRIKDIVGVGTSWLDSIPASLNTLWGKFHATTGHKHTAAAGDAPALDNTGMVAAQRLVVICTSTTRPSSPPTGQLIYETDTTKVMKNTGTPEAPNWVEIGAAGLTRGAATWYIPGFLVTGANQSIEFPVPQACTIERADGRVKTAPTGAAIIIDINKNGTTIWTTQANRLTIAAGATTGYQTAFDVTALAQGDILTIDIDQVGSTEPGRNLTVALRVVGA